MSRFVIFILAFLFILSIFFIDDEKLSKKLKILISVFLVVLAFLAFFYEENFKNRTSQRNEISLAFSQGKILKCGDLEIDKQNFEFSFATQTFIAKKTVSGTFKNRIFKISDCEIKK